MRNVKFRGKRIYNGEWVYGYLFKIWDKCYILWETTNNNNVPKVIEVEQETIGQFIGLHDKNGKEIHEGDIVKIQDELCIVEYNYNAFCLKVIDQTKPYGWVDFIVYKCEVIGNIYENKNLLNT